MPFDVITSTKQLNRLLEAPGRLLEVAANGFGTVLDYKGPVPSLAAQPDPGDFATLGLVEPATLAAWFCLREYPRHGEPNGPFHATWHVRGADTWTQHPGLTPTPDGWFLVDRVARTITERLSGKTMTEAEVLAHLATPQPNVAAGVFLRTMAGHLMRLPPDEGEGGG